MARKLEDRSAGITRTSVKARGMRREDRLVSVNPPVTPLDPEESLVIPPVHGYIRLRLKEVAVARGCIVPYGAHRGEANLSAIMRGTGLAWTTVWQLANNPDSISGMKLETIARLCAFFQCTVGDLLEFRKFPHRTLKPKNPPAPIMNIIDDDDESNEPVVTGLSRW
jgi:DNA-binding Xre family transcriptional regulator